MRLATGQALKALEQFVVNALGTELVDEVVVIDSHLHDVTPERESKVSLEEDVSISPPCSERDRRNAAKKSARM